MTGGTVEHFHEETRLAGFGGFGFRRVIVRDIDGAHPLHVRCPHQRKRKPGLPKTARVNRVQRQVLAGLRGVVFEPPAVEAFWIGFRRAGEMPVAVPDFYPRVIPTQIRPERRADDPRWNANRPARVDQQNRQARAGGETVLHRFERALIGLRTPGGVTNVDELEQFLVEPLRGFGGRLAIRDQWRAFLAKQFAPVVALLVHARVRKNVVEKNFLRHLITPRRFRKSFVGERDIFEQQRCGQCLQIALRHVVEQEQQSLALCRRHFTNGPGYFTAIVAGLGDCSFNDHRLLLFRKRGLGAI